MIESIEHGPVLELRLERPPANALSPELISALGALVRGAPQEGARALVLSGREGMFSAGLDVPLFLELDRAGVGRAWRDFFDLMQALALAPIPTVAALTGHSPAGGCVLALFCDQRILARGPYRIGLNEVSVGLRMPRPIAAAARYAVGPRQAERLCTQSVLLEGEEALRIGLVDELVEPQQVVPRAVEWAERMAALPPGALARTRAILRQDLARPFEDIDEDQLELFLDEWFSDETQGALGALVERLASR